MCGRFAQNYSQAKLLAFLESLVVKTEHKDRVQIFPSQMVPVVIGGSEPALVSMKWGIRTGWNLPGNKPASLINARAETVSTRKSFKGPFQSSRCLIPMSGYYEWHASEGKKIPHHIYSREQTILLAAGIYVPSESGSEDIAPTFSIITTKAHASVRTIHDRQPAFIARDSLDLWLNGDSSSAGELLCLPQFSLETERLNSIPRVEQG